MRFLALLLMCSSASAGEIADAIARRLNPPVPSAVTTPVIQDERQAVPPQKTVCQCRGTNRAVCMCLKAGVTCHCSANSGSVWERASDSAKWVKTTRKGNPNQPAEASPTLPPAGEGKPIVELVTDPSYCTPCRQLEASIQAFGEDNLPFVLKPRKPRAGETIPRFYWGNGKWQHVGYEPIQSFVRRWEYANSLTETR